ncbi:MAG: HNH endonuclease [Thermodesulfobacteriota bacterium]|jgi:hypothetical protein|nr:MAG: HNH endonuclease [Thermodesulfobacteriota bacterium]
MTIYEQLLDYCEAQKRIYGKVTFTSGELKDALLESHGTPRTSTLPPDYCYNIMNDGIHFKHHLFEQIGETYKFLGPGYLYSGVITWKGTPVGAWQEGSFFLWKLFRKVNRRYYRPELRPTETSEASPGTLQEVIERGNISPGSLHTVDSPAPEENLLLPFIDVREVQRKDATVSRIIRDTKQTKLIKQLYKHCCQVCGIALQTSAGPYAEAAHIVPLGQPHNGSDTVDNILCLCPNHHVLFDYGAFSVSDSLILLGMPGKLSVHPQHIISKKYLAHHRNRNIK